MKTVSIASRFRGPPASANGGYFAGVVAGCVARTVTVRLIRPPPLDTPLSVEELPQGVLRLLNGTDSQHVLDAIFKALGVALAQATSEGGADGG